MSGLLTPDLADLRQVLGGDMANLVLFLSSQRGGIEATGTLKDLSGEGNDCTLAGDTYVDADGIHFDGNDSGSITDIARLGTTVQSQMLWFRRTGASTNQYILDQGANNHWISITNTKVVGGAAAGAYMTGNTVTGTDTWYHVGMTYGTVTQTLYVNGVYDNSRAVGTNAPSTIVLGKYGGNSLYFTGQVDDIVITDSELTAAQVKAHYNSTKWRFSNA